MDISIQGHHISMIFEMSFRRTNTVFKLITVFALWGMLGFILSYLLIGKAQAASFDCELAQSASEKLICSSPELSKLDEELARQYKSRLTTANNPIALKSEQRRWLKQLREQCQDTQCYIQAYNERMSLWQTPPTNELASNTIAETNSHQAEKPDYKALRFKFCESNQSITCKQTGHGNTICEAYLKHLNSISEDWPHAACKVWVNPTRGDIHLPQWQSLDIESNLALVYQLVSFERVGSPTFAKWQADYVSKLKSGKIYPSLKQLEVALKKGEPAKTLVRYEEGNSEITGCDKNDFPIGYPIGYGNRTNSEIFILDQHKNIVKPVHYNGVEMLFYKSRPFFIRQSMMKTTDSINWHVYIRQPDTSYDTNYIPLTCEIINTKYGIKEAKLAFNRFA
ncbi:MAG: lysozyme inhibitor LprI family protein [Rheinheimera sp.]